jgi:hypothetical protein
VPPDIPVDGIPVDGKFSPLDVPPDMGIDELELEVVGITAAGEVPGGTMRSIGSGFFQLSAWS